MGSPFPLQDMRSVLTPLLGSDIEGQAIEIEARFGNFRGRAFQSGVSLNTFTRLRKLGITDPRTYVHSKDEIFREDDERVRERYTTYYNEEGMPMSSHRLVKTRIHHFDFPDLFVRVAISIETQDQAPKPDGIPLIREKKRWSYHLPGGQFRLDLTEVTTIPRDNPRNAETVYEVELEIEPPKLNGLALFKPIIEAVLRIVHDTRILYTTSQKLELITQINIYLGSRINNPLKMDKAILNQARDLKAKDLVVGGIIPANDHGINYTVSIKADGVRKLLVIDVTGIYLVMPPTDINKIFGPDVSQRLGNWIGTIVEGELIPKESLTDMASDDIRQAEIYFLMYDCLSLAGDWRVRSDPHSTHMDRLKKVEPLVRIFEPIKGIRFEKKVFEPFQELDQFYRAVNRTLDHPWPFKNDGLIFTPNNYQYDTELFKTSLESRGLKKYPDLLKWKPERLWTIDFLIQHVSSADGNYVELHTVVDANLEPFRGNDIYLFDPKINVKRSDLLDGAPTGTIGEFSWLPSVDEVPGQLQLVRIREDKDQPNMSRVAIDVWEDMHQPVDEEVLRGRKFGLMFRYHNRIKWDLFRQVGNSLPKVDGVRIKSRVLLDIGSGWGQDVSKMAANGFTHVICVEPDQSKRIELKKRLDGSGLQYRIVPRQGQDVDAIIQAVREFSPTQAVDAISYMLSLSFFFGSPEATRSIYDLINATLAYGGYLMALTIDGRYVLNFFNEPANVISDDTQNNQVLRSAFTMITFELRLEPTMRVYVDIPGTIVEGQTEDLTNLPDLYQMLTGTEDGSGIENGVPVGEGAPLRMHLISEQRADQEAFMTVEEQVFTQLYTYFVMKRLE